jgi:DNA-binding transcriptional ArsR family regulator
MFSPLHMSMECSILKNTPPHFVPARTMNADNHLARIAGAIAEPARARMLCCLLDGHARTSTELSVVAEVSPSTASAHLARLKEEQLVQLLAQGKHRYYQLADANVAAALEALLVVAGLPRPAFKPNTPDRLRHARTCYDHMAGTVAVRLHDHMAAQGWLSPDSSTWPRKAGYPRTAANISSRPPANKASAPSASTPARCASCAAALPVPAWTGASASRTWAAPWARRC